MENWEHYTKLGGMIFGASGLWKLLELYVRSRMDKKVKFAESNHIQAQASAQMVNTCLRICQQLEEKVRELEGKIKSLETENLALRDQISKFKP